MPQNRQLAAIMFTDIEGYTSIMQGNEEVALHLREEHRTIFNAVTEKYGGKILQYYGDGTLSIFDSAISAVECGVEMQLAFLRSSNVIPGNNGVPVRIGIHLGDIISTAEDIIGDAVNIASRIESLAIAGSVLISDKVHDEIKNQPSFSSQYKVLLTWRKKLAGIDTKPETQIDLAEAMMLNGKFYEAKQTLDGVLDKYPNYPEAIGTMTVYYTLNKQYDKADSLLQKMIIHDPDIEPLTTEYHKTFQFAKKHSLNVEDLQKYEGHYRLQERAAEFDIKIMEGHLFGKGRTNTDVFFMIPNDQVYP